MELTESLAQGRAQVAVLGSPSKAYKEAFLLNEENAVSPAAFGDTYSLAPLLLNDLNELLWASALEAPTTHTFDGAVESGGNNTYGSAGGTFTVTEGIVDLGAGVERYVVEVSAVDSTLDFEPWVDASWAGQVLTAWILEVGTTNGGGNTLSPGYAFSLLDSGLLVFDSAGAQLGNFPISDTSTLTTLAGSAGINLGGADIAGFDVATMQMYWEITPVNSDPDILIRPLTLDFVQQAPPPGQVLASPVISPLPLRKVISPELTEKLKNRGEVKLIVGLNLTTQVAGKLNTIQAQQQRQSIRAQGDQLALGLQGLNAQIRRQFEFVPYMALTADQATLDFLLQSPLVTSITEDTLNRPNMASSNPVIGSPLAWAEGYDGSGWAVAVLDTGVDNTHPWFTSPVSKVVAEACYSTNLAGVESWCPGGASSSTAVDSGLNCDLSVGGCDHGTHVAGTVAGNDETGPDFGVARGADIIAMQVFSKFLTDADCGAGQAPCTASFSSDQIAAMERVLVLSNSMNIAAVNMSLGGGSYTDQASCDAANGAVKAAIDNLRSVGIATVIAAGNNGLVDRISTPGCISTAISVGATSDSDAVASFSNIYPQIHLLAPGVDIDSSVPGGGIAPKNGTSMATPHVAGAWAIMKQVNPGATVSEVLTTLQNSATLVDDLRPGGIETGMPRINLELAIGEPRTTFGIFNDGGVTLTITSITPQTPAPWLSWSPLVPFNVEPGELVVVSVFVDYGLAPAGVSQVRLLVNSNDPDESPYPNGIFVNVTTSDLIFRDSFEAIPNPVPDLVVISPGVSNAALSPSQVFAINATAKNQGNGASAASTLRYYLSNDNVITAGDTGLGTDAIPGLSADAISAQSLDTTAPGVDGTYWVGACVDTVAGELNTGNQCSTAVQIIVSTVVVDTDNDRLSDAAETNTGIYVDENNTGTDPNNPDTDGDGIKDGDEVLGTLAGLDLPAMGTNPLRKDLLLEYDWFDDGLDCSPHSHRPTAAAIASAATAFSTSPVNNPGSTSGVNLISDYGQGGAFTGGNLINDADGVIADGVNGTEFSNHKVANFASNRNGYFHYVLLPHRYNTSSGSSGQAEYPGDDLIVSLYCANTNSNVAHTIMHEVGHNLFLHHGGNEACNYKPNYNSVMSYKYQFPGIDNDCTPDPDGVLSYSIGDRISLNENNLNENNGTCGPGFPWDWNGVNGFESSISFDVNNSGNSTCGGVLTILNDYNDWGNISFGGLGDADGALAVPQQIITEQPVPAEFLNRID